MRIIFFGSDPWFSPSVLAALIAAGHEVPIVVTKGDAFKNFRFKISNLRFTDVKTAEDISRDRLESLLRPGLAAARLPARQARPGLSKPDAIVLAAFGPPFLAAEVLKWPKYGCLNVHASLLPRWRGAAPVFAALAAGDKETGVSIMRMTKEIDRGPILGVKRLCLVKQGRALPYDRESLTKRLGILGGKLIVETLKKLSNDQITEVNQPAKSPTPYTRRLTKESGRIDWSQSPIAIERFILATAPWPGAWTEYREEGRRKKEEGRKLKILKAHLEQPLRERDCHGRLRRPRNDVVLVIDEVQLPGKNPVSWKQFLAGHPGAELG